MMASNAYLETYLKLMILLILYLCVCVCVYIYIYNRTQRPILYIYTNERTNLIYGCGIFLKVRKKLKNRENWKKNN
jgi:hypothetical protein